MAKTHRVIQGESLSGIAKKYGFNDWRTIYKCQENTEFRRQRPNPNVIYPGDQVFIPSKDIKEENGNTGKRHIFRKKGSLTLLRLVLHGEDGQPLADVKYQLKIPIRQGYKVYENTTRKDGLVKHEIPADADEGELTLWIDKEDLGEGYTLPIKISHLDPVEEITGVQARLNNLGFECGAIDGLLGSKTEDAIKAFQEQYKEQGLKANGIADEQTRAKLQELHGC